MRGARNGAVPAAAVLGAREDHRGADVAVGGKHGAERLRRLRVVGPHRHLRHEDVAVGAGDGAQVLLAVALARRRERGDGDVALHQLHGRAPEAEELVDQPLRRGATIAGMVGERADARDGEVLLQLLDVLVAVGVDEIDDVVHRALR